MCTCMLVTDFCVTHCHQPNGGASPVSLFSLECNMNVITGEFGTIDYFVADRLLLFLLKLIIWKFLLALSFISTRQLFEIQKLPSEGRILPFEKTFCWTTHFLNIFAHMSSDSDSSLPTGELATIDNALIGHISKEKLENFHRIQSLDLHLRDGRKLRTMEGLHLVPNLKYLNLSYNSITIIEGLDRCSKLVELNLAENSIVQVASFWLSPCILFFCSLQIENLEKLCSLQKLNLSGNRIRRIPESISALVCLNTFRLARNEVSSHKLQWRLLLLTRSCSLRLLVIYHFLGLLVSLLHDNNGLVFDSVSFCRKPLNSPPWWKSHMPTSTFSSIRHLHDSKSYSFEWAFNHGARQVDDPAHLYPSCHSSHRLRAGKKQRQDLKTRSGRASRNCRSASIESCRAHCIPSVLMLMPFQRAVPAPEPKWSVGSNRWQTLRCLFPSQLLFDFAGNEAHSD